MRKKNFLMLVVIFIAIFLAACSHNAYKQAMEDGKHAIEIKDYDAAFTSFQKAVELKPKKEEAQIYLHQVENYINGIDLFNEEAFEEAKMKFQEAVNNDGSQIVNEEASERISEIDIILANLTDVEERMDRVVHLKADENYEDALKLIDEILAVEGTSDTLQNYQAAMKGERETIENKLNKLVNKTDFEKKQEQAKNDDNKTLNELEKAPVTTDPVKPIKEKSKSEKPKEQPKNEKENKKAAQKEAEKQKMIDQNKKAVETEIESIKQLQNKKKYQEALQKINGLLTNNETVNQFPIYQQQLSELKTAIQEGIKLAEGKTNKQNLINHVKGYWQNTANEFEFCKFADNHFVCAIAASDQYFYGDISAWDADVSTKTVTLTIKGQEDVALTLENNTLRLNGTTFTKLSRADIQAQLPDYDLDLFFDIDRYKSFDQ